MGIVKELSNSNIIVSLNTFSIIDFHFMLQQVMFQAFDSFSGVTPPLPYTHKRNGKVSSLNLITFFLYLE